SAAVARQRRVWHGEGRAGIASLAGSRHVLEEEGQVGSQARRPQAGCGEEGCEEGRHQGARHGQEGGLTRTTTWHPDRLRFRSLSCFGVLSAVSCNEMA